MCAEANFGGADFEKLCDSDGAWRRVKYYCWVEVSDVARIGRSGEASSCAGEKFLLPASRLKRLKSFCF